MEVFVELLANGMLIDSASGPSSYSQSDFAFSLSHRSGNWALSITPFNIQNYQKRAQTIWIVKQLTFPIQSKEVFIAQKKNKQTKNEQNFDACCAIVSGWCEKILREKKRERKMEIVFL